MPVFATYNLQSGNTRNPYDVIFGRHRIFPKLPDVIFLQEVRHAAPIYMPRSPSAAVAPLFSYDDIHRPWARVLDHLPHRHTRALLTRDAGIILTNRTWRVLNQDFGPRWARVEVALPTPLVASEPESDHLVLYSIHGAFRASFWLDDEPQLLTFLNTATTGHRLIVGSDVNAWGSPLDSTHGLLGGVPWSAVRSLMDSLDIVDVYRVLQPSGRMMTRFDGRTGTGRRIDAIWASRALVTDFHTPEVHDTSASDHRIFSISCGQAASAAQHLGANFWRLHPGLWHHPTVVDAIRSLVTDLCDANATPPTEWFQLKARIRARLWTLSRQLGDAQQRLISRLPTIRATLRDLDLTLPAARRLYAELTLELSHAERAQTAQDTYQDHGRARPHWLFKKRPATHNLPTLHDSGGRPLSPDARLDHVRDHFTRFYSDPGTRNEANPDGICEPSDRLLRAMRRHRITMAQRRLLASPFTLHELRVALRGARDAAAGLDGLPYAVLAHLPATGQQALLRLANGMLEGKSLPAGEPQLRGRMIPKATPAHPPTVKDLRPLIISSTDIRTIGRMVNNRMRVVAPTVCPAPAQNGFIPGRSGHDVLVHLYMLQEHHRRSPGSSGTLLISVDQAKAYDRVHRRWLDLALQELQSPPQFRRLVRTLLRSPNVIYDVNGRFTDPVPLHIGIYQGDPASCLHFAFQLQPLLTAASEAIGVSLPTGAGRVPYTFSALAFADDILFCHDPSNGDVATRLAALHAVLDDYCAASNARINQDKSFVTLLHAEGQGAAEVLFDDLADTLRYPARREDEIVVLGAPFRLSSRGPPGAPLDTLLNKVRRHTLWLNPSNEDDLFQRRDYTNSHLLTKLWHALSLCPLSIDLESRVRHVVAPFIFKGNKSWIRWAKVALRPARLGGLGVIPTEDMVLARTLAIVAPYLTGTHPAARAFQEGLHRYIVQDCDSCPALLICQVGRAFFRLRNRLKVQTSFYARVIWALWRAQVRLSDDWEAYTLDEVLTLPWLNTQYAPLEMWPTSPALLQRDLSSRRWTFADIIWWNDTATTFPHPHKAVSGAIVPVSPAGIDRNYHHPQHRLPLGDSCLKFGCSNLDTNWAVYWPNLPARFRHLFSHDLRLRYGLHPNRTTSRRLHGRPQDRPFRLEPSSFHFPFHRLLVNGTPLADASTKHIRNAMQSSTPVQPPYWDDQFTSTLEEWRNIWIRIDNLNLPSNLRTSTFLFQHGRAWLATQPPPVAQDAAVVEDDSDEEHASPTAIDALVRNAGLLAGNDTLTAVELNYLSSADPIAEFEDALDDTPVPFHILPCPRCQGIRDSVAHGYIHCPLARDIWRLAIPALTDLVGRDMKNLPLQPRGIVLGWPDDSGSNHSRLPNRLRPRLLLWRSAVLHEIADMRRRAFARSRHLGEAPSFHDVATGVIARHVRATIYNCLNTGYSRRTTNKSRANFANRWVNGGRLASVAPVHGTTLELHAEGTYRPNTP